MTDFSALFTEDILMFLYCQACYKAKTMHYNGRKDN